MRIAIMQPYFYPYLGYFSLIKNTEKFILFDPVQYIRHGWIERNRVLKQNGGWNYVQVPLVKNKGRETIIKDLEVRVNENWKAKILGQLTFYKKKAPHYHQVINLLKDSLDENETSLVRIVENTLKMTCDYIGIKHDILVFSEMNVKISSEEIKDPDDWALQICKKMHGVDEYWNPPGGKSFFSREKYEEAGIKLKFHEMELNEYPQLGDEFEKGLSIIDVLMFNSPEEVKAMLDNYSLS